MPGPNHDLDQIIVTLGRLKDRVGQLDAAEAPHRRGEQSETCLRMSSDALNLLRVGQAELDALQRPIDFPAFFLRLAARTGLRMLFLKQWRSGLQVCAECNLSMPPEAKSRRPDGKAPIPSEPDDLFAAVARERQVYAGPVPIKDFPVDLTLLLGRDAQDRRIIILPLPARDHWSTFIYLDGERGRESSLAVAEFLARHAVDRLRLLQSGELMPEGEVAAMLKKELHRRRSRLRSHVNLDDQHLGVEHECPEHTEGDGSDNQADAPRQDGERHSVDLEWVHRQAEDDSGRVAAGAGQDDQAAARGEWSSELPPLARRINQARYEADAIVKAWEDAVLGAPPCETTHYDATRATPLLPEDILHQSGDLPAMPKAALHILSVIENPSTTATRLERAVVMDQALTAKILRIANSPFYGAVREIKTVSEAIVRLGFVTIRNWTLVTATKSVFLGAGAGLLYHRIWRQSVLSGMSAQLVAQAMRRPEPETVFVGGLMQNIGQLVLARSHLDLFQQVLMISSEERMPYHLVEQELLGFDHGDLGALLIKEWNLSEELEQGVRWHHRLDHPDVQCRELAAMIALGEEIAACTSNANESDDGLHHGNSRAAGVLGISAQVFQRLQTEARNLSIDPGLFA